MLRAFFIALSRNKFLRAFSERSPVGRKLSSRFVAGMQIADVLRAAEAVNRQGIAVTLDSLGENVSTAMEAERSAAVYHQLLDAIRQRNLNANVSVKLTQMGMDLDPLLAERIVGKLVAHAAQVDSFVRVDMEGTLYTEATIAMVERLHAQHPGRVGTVIQAYLYRSEQDIARLLRQGIRIRLCKGAYQESAEHAFPLKADVDANYVKLMQVLVTSGIYHGIATHDEAIVAQMKQFAPEHNVSPDAFEFQMLYGVRRDLQRKLVQGGFRVRVYVPFGAEWYPYFMRRLAERPANVLFLLKNLFKN